MARFWLLMANLTGILILALFIAWLGGQL